MGHLGGSQVGARAPLVSELNARGHIALSEDLSILDQHTVLSGPRSCDLRHDAAVHLGRGTRYVPRADARVGEKTSAPGLRRPI